MKFISIYFFFTLMHTQFLRHPYFAGGNKRFLLKIVIFLKLSEMCLMCAHSEFLLSQTKVHDHVIIRCYYYLLNVLSLEIILDQNLRRSNFRLCTSFDPRIIIFTKEKKIHFCFYKWRKKAFRKVFSCWKCPTESYML